MVNPALGGGRTTPKLSLKPIRVPTPDGCVDRGYDKGRRPLPGSVLFADDIVLCDDDETDMTEYMETWRRERGMRISSPKTQFIDFKFGQDNGQGSKRAG